MGDKACGCKIELVKQSEWTDYFQATVCPQHTADDIRARLNEHTVKTGRGFMVDFRYLPRKKAGR